MGLFDIFKKKKNLQSDCMKKMFDSLFPKGEQDINAGTNKLLRILNNKISRDEARSIFIKSYSLSSLSEKFDTERLKVHLSGYCLHYFSDKQVDDFHGYLVSLIFAMTFSGKSPSQVESNDDIILF